MTDTTNSLGTTSNKVSKLHNRRRHGHDRLSAAGRLLEGWQVSYCMKTPRNNTVEVWSNGETAHYKGLHWCSSVWTCPVCASRITEVRRQELRQAVAANNYAKVLVTVTMQHDRPLDANDKRNQLKALIEDLNKALKRLKAGRWWQEFCRRWHVVAHVSSLETTYGANGWHPHKHWLVWLDLPEGEIDAERLKTELTDRYKALLAKSGRYASDIYGIDVQIGDQAAGDYVAKWSLEDEVTKAAVKDGREGGLSVWQLLDRYIDGDDQAGALFVEYAKATLGKRQLVWSKGGRAKLGLGKEKTDEEIALAAEDETEDNDRILVTLDRQAWSTVVRKNAVIDLLEVADGADLAHILAFLDRLGVRQGVAFGAPIGTVT